MSEMNVSNMNEEKKKAEENEGCATTAVVWGIVAFIGSFIAGFFLEYNQELGFGRRFLVILVSVICGTPGGLIGALIGDFIRKIAHPDMVFTFGDGGAWDMLKVKIYWAIGPQLIGVIVGCYITIGITAQQLADYFSRNY